MFLGSIIYLLVCLLSVYLSIYLCIYVIHKCSLYVSMCLIASLKYIHTLAFMPKANLLIPYSSTICHLCAYLHGAGQ